MSAVICSPAGPAWLSTRTGSRESIRTASRPARAAPPMISSTARAVSAGRRRLGGAGTEGRRAAGASGAGFLRSRSRVGPRGPGRSSETYWSSVEVDVQTCGTVRAPPPLQVLPRCEAGQTDSNHPSGSRTEHRIALTRRGSETLRSVRTPGAPGTTSMRLLVTIETPGSGGGQDRRGTRHDIVLELRPETGSATSRQPSPAPPAAVPANVVALPGRPASRP